MHERSLDGPTLIRDARILLKRSLRKILSTRADLRCMRGIHAAPCPLVPLGGARFVGILHQHFEERRQNILETRAARSVTTTLDDDALAFVGASPCFLYRLGEGGGGWVGVHPTGKRVEVRRHDTCRTRDRWSTCEMGPEGLLAWILACLGTARTGRSSQTRVYMLHDPVMPGLCFCLSRLSGVVGASGVCLRQREFDAGVLPDFLPETKHIREDKSWRVRLPWKRGNLHRSLRDARD